MNVATLTADLIAEQEALEAVVAPLHAEDWALATPSPRWSVADQIAHLTYFDESAARAVTDPAAFATDIDRMMEAAAGGDEAADELTLGELRMLEPPQLLDRWRRGRHLLAEAAATLGDGDRVGWYGPPMSAKTFLSARLMEVWAHGQDIIDTIGGRRRASPGARDWLLIAQAFAGPPTDGPAPGARA